MRVDTKAGRSVAVNIWDQRYGREEFFYGTEPNDFLRAHAQLIPKGGTVLCLAEGEGRNAVYLASLGYRVTGVDGSAVGIAKLRKLAAQQKVSVTAIVSDLGAFEIAPDAWDAIVSIWCHLPVPLRSRVYRACVAGLKPGGTFLLEAYHPRQLTFKTGGPPTADLMATLDALRGELDGLELIEARELERMVQEGQGHHGQSAVVQVVARKPRA
jgi:SAM-dependent methyltransferase